MLILYQSVRNKVRRRTDVCVVCGGDIDQERKVAALDKKAAEEGQCEKSEAPDSPLDSVVTGETGGADRGEQLEHWFWWPGLIG